LQEQELLKYAIESGMIDLQHLQAEIDMKERRQYLKQHPYSIWQGKNDNKFYTYLPDDTKKRILVKRNTEEEIQNVVINYWKEQELNPTLQEVFDEWNDRRLGLKKIVPSTHERNQQVFRRHYKGIEDKRIRSVTEDWIMDFLEQQIAIHDLTSKAFSNLKGVTKGFLKRAKRRKLIDLSIESVLNDMDLSDRDFRKVIKEDYEEVFSEEETDKMMAYLQSNLDVKNLGILLIFVTGLRVGELVALKHEDFNGNIIKIRRTEVRYADGHGKHEYCVKEFPKTEAGVRSAIIPADFTWLADRLKLLNPFGEYVFTDNGKRLTTNTIRRRLTRLCQKLNIYAKSPHKIRKTYGSILIDNNLDARLITDLMGHTNISTTEQHYHRNRKTMIKKAQIIANIPEFQAK
jgi:integrase